MSKELIIEIGKLFKHKQVSSLDLTSLIYKLSLDLKTTDVCMGVFNVKSTNHLAFFEKRINSEYSFTINATKSSKLFGIKNIPCKDVHSCVSTNILENHNKTIDGFYACSYIKRDLIGLNISQDMYDIAIRNGVIHEKDYVKIFNIILNKHRFDYINSMIYYQKNKSFNYPINISKNRSILIQDIDNGKIKTYKVSNGSYIEFMKEYDDNNILCNITWDDINEDFMRGVWVCNFLLKGDVLTNISEYGSEGLDYLNINPNEIMGIIDNFNRII